MVSDSDEWWDKYYQGNTKQYLDSLLNQNNPQGTKLLSTNQRQIYDRLPIELRWNEVAERDGTAYSGIVLEYLVPEPVTVEPITPVTTVQPQQEHIVTISATTNQIISDITAGILQAPDWFINNIDWVKSGQINENTFLTAYHDLVNRHLIHEAFGSILEPGKTWSGWVTKPSGKVERITLTISTMQRLIEEGWIFTEEEPVTVLEPEKTWSGWVTKPSGKVERITLTISTMQRLIEEGWIFTTDKPPEPQPENQNVSIIFYIGKGGDLKTHFGINSIVITPDEAKNLADWLSQNYNTKILLVTNRLTDDIRTHTLQQIKDLIVQKLKDDQPESDDIDDGDIKKPKELGFMGAGMAGAIAGLVLLGFVIDHKVGK